MKIPVVQLLVLYRVGVGDTSKPSGTCRLGETLADLKRTVF